MMQKPLLFKLLAKVYNSFYYNKSLLLPLIKEGSI